MARLVSSHYSIRPCPSPRPSSLSSSPPSSHKSLWSAGPIAAQHERMLSYKSALLDGFAEGRTSPGGGRQRNRHSSCSSNGNSGGNGGDGLGGGGYGDSGSYSDDEDDSGSSPAQWIWGLLSSFSNGWQERVHADPQFPFKILIEEIIGVAASVLGDMACRPSFGLSELDFIFSNLIVCAIVNFALMYILAPTPSASAAATSLPGFFFRCPPGHMWEPGVYTPVQRAGTFVYKGAVFASVGFCAGLVGTALSTTLLSIRKKIDSSFCLQNAPPDTLLNACTWALQLGVSSNLRYQLLNGLEFGLEGAMNPSIFKGLVLGIRSLNNVVGGMSFMMMARLTGSQHIARGKPQEQAHQLLAVHS